MDQTIEETAKKDTQTPGGTKGFILNAKAVSRYYITADYKRSCVRQLREMVNRIMSRGSKKMNAMSKI